MGAGSELEKPNLASLVSLLRRAWERWKVIARVIGNVQARILLGIFYAIILAPFALAVRWGSDPLAIKRGTARGWSNPRQPDGTALEQAMRQF